MLQTLMNSNNSVKIKEQKISKHFEVDCEKRKSLLNVLNNNKYDPNNPDRLLGVDWYDREQTIIQTKYYIGLKWIKENESYLLIEPKIEILDFMTMFMHCFDHECRDVSDKLGKIYHIDFNAVPIKINSAQSILTPMLIVHFLKLTECIIRKGLKFNYVKREENLCSKIKGKVLLNQNIKRNYSVGRADRTVCRYQDYSVDCIENRILKKTLLFVNKFINIYSDISCSTDLRKIVTYCLSAMTSIDDKLPIQQLKQFKINPLYKEYAEVLKVAQMILKRFSYNIELINYESEKFLPPFWIDMSLLFELYVYSKLKTAYKDQIDYHVSTYGNEIDFVKYDENLIIDTKYILDWENQVNHGNIRQLSGYARNIALRKKIIKKEKDETTILDCLIIYPNKNGIYDFTEKNIIKNELEIGTYLKFHKLGIKLPTKDSSKTSNK